MADKHSEPGKWCKTFADISRAASVNQKTASKWPDREDWRREVKKTRWGWLKADVLRFAEKRIGEERAAGRRGGIAEGSLRDQKLTKEIERLGVLVQREEEHLSQDRIETARLRGEMWSRDSVMQSWTERNARIMARIDTWRQTESTKRRTVKDKRLIDGLADGLQDELRREFEV